MLSTLPGRSTQLRLFWWGQGNNQEVQLPAVVNGFWWFLDHSFSLISIHFNGSHRVTALFPSVPQDSLCPLWSAQTAQHLWFWSSVLGAVRKVKTALNELCDTTQFLKEKGWVSIPVANLEDLHKFVGVSGWQVLYRCDLGTLMVFCINIRLFSQAGSLSPFMTLVLCNFNTVL